MKGKKLNFRKIIVSLLLIYFSFILVKQEMSMVRLNAEARSASIEFQKVKATEEQSRAQLEESKTNPKSFAERQAREKLGYIKPNETPVMPKYNNK